MGRIRESNGIYRKKQEQTIRDKYTIRYLPITSAT